MAAGEVTTMGKLVCSMARDAINSNPQYVGAERHSSALVTFLLSQTIVLRSACQPCMSALHVSPACRPSLILWLAFEIECLAKAHNSVQKSLVVDRMRLTVNRIGVC